MKRSSDRPINSLSYSFSVTDKISLLELHCVLNLNKIQLVAIIIIIMIVMSVLIMIMMIIDIFNYSKDCCSWFRR